MRWHVIWVAFQPSATMRFEISRQHCSQKSVITLRLSHSNPSPMSRSLIAQPTQTARLDIRARGFWCTGQDTIFDVRVFHPNAPSNCSMTTTAAYREHEARVCPTSPWSGARSLYTPRTFNNWWNGPQSYNVLQETGMTEFSGRSKINTQLSWDGSVVVYHLQSSAPPSYVFVVADLLTTVQSMNWISL